MFYIYEETLNSVVQESLKNNKDLTYNEHVQWCLEHVNGIVDNFGDSCVRNWIDNILKERLLNFYFSKED